MFTKLKIWLGLAGATVIVMLVALIKAFNAGKALEQAKQAKADKDAVAAISEARNEAKSSSDEEINQEVDKWTRRKDASGFQ